MMATKKDRRQKAVATNAQVKMFAYLCSLARDREFLNEVSEIRKKFSLPSNGFEEDIKDEFAFIEALPVYTDERGNETDFQKEVYDLASRLYLSVPWLNAVTSYVLYDDFFATKTPPFIQMMALDEIIDEQAEREEGDDVWSSITDAFPIALFISPYATGRDIIDYVKKRYKQEIEPAQSKHREEGVRIGRVRRRNADVAERDEFICKHKDLSASKLAHLVHEKYGGKLLGYTYISKIIAKKCKRENK